MFTQGYHMVRSAVVNRSQAPWRAALVAAALTAAGMVPALAGTTRADAFRLLNQASFGPTPALVDRVATLGAAGWINEQMAMPARDASMARWAVDDAQARATSATGEGAGKVSVISSFYQQALGGEDQLRQRVAFALSEIFVVSLSDLHGRRAELVASWLDMLQRNAFGNYRQLLEEVSLHPAMGLYLSSLNNRKEDPASGRIPDQNYARELMQLFSIGLQVLEADGSPRLGSNGLPLETYGPQDIVGLSRVFTGFGWTLSEAQVARASGTVQDTLYRRPMQAIPVWHSVLEKRFLGVSVPAQASAQPAVSLKAALDTLAAHPNVGPFIGRQLIQRLVTSHPSPAYVARVARTFDNNGRGQRGDLGAVVRSVLLDPEARSASAALAPQQGKLREPVLRLTAWLRATGARSDSGLVLMDETDDPASALGQTPLQSPSVFNFFRPAHVPTGGEASALGLTVPEMQITNETSVAGYANYMLAAVTNGTGRRGLSGRASRPDLQPDFSADLAVADQSGPLVDQVCLRLLGPVARPALRAALVAAVDQIKVPTLRRDGSNRALIDKALLNRVRLTHWLVLVSPEFIVQK